MQNKPPNTTLPTATSLPTGTVTFLFTDIVGLTPLWKRQLEVLAVASSYSA